MENRIVIITGPSGAGKTSLLKFLLSERGSEVCKVISTTTREKRPGEINGKDYHFLTKEDFKEGLKGNAYVEHEEVFPNKYYGISKVEILNSLRANKVPILIMDINGALKFRNQISMVENGDKNNVIGLSSGIDYEFINFYKIQFQFFFIYTSEEELINRIIKDNKMGIRNDKILDLEDRACRIKTELAFMDYFTQEEQIKNSGDLNFVGNILMNEVFYPSK